MGNFANDDSDETRLVNKAFPYTFQEAPWQQQEYLKWKSLSLLVRIPTILRVLPSKNGGCSSYFDEFNE